MLKHQAAFLGALCLLLLFGGCAGLGTSSQAPPSSVDIAISLQELRDNFGDYAVYYSGKRNNPSAILFIPKQSDFQLQLHWAWYQIEQPDLLHRMLDTIDKIYPRLYSLLAPQAPEKDSRDVLAFIYTPGYASVHETEKPRTYYVRPVPMQPHPDSMLHDGNGDS